MQKDYFRAAERRRRAAAAPRSSSLTPISTLVLLLQLFAQFIFILWGLMIPSTHCSLHRPKAMHYHPLRQPGCQKIKILHVSPIT